MNKGVIIAIVAAVILIAGGVYWYGQAAPQSAMQDESALPPLTQSDSFEDIEQDLDGINVVVEDSEYSTVESDINGL